MSPRAASSTALVLLALHGALAIASLWQKSPVYDEVSHLPAGLALVRTGEVRLNPQHPPLVKLAAGLAAAPLHPALPLLGEAYRSGNEWEFGRQVLFGLGNDDMGLLRRGRLPTVALSILAGAIVFLWARARWGAEAGLLCLALYAFCPTVLAHACWVTMDIPMTAFATLTLYLWWRASRRGESIALLGCGVSLGLALATKFSGLILLPAMALCDVLANGAFREWRLRLLRWGILGVLAWTVIEVVYLFPSDPLRYVHDLRHLYADTGIGPYNYLAGAFRTGSRFPQYFLVAMAVKSAVPGLLAIAAGLACAALRREEWREDLYLWLPAALWIGVHSIAANDIGVRYVLPAYPLLFLLSGGAADWLRRSAPRLGVVALIVVALAQASEAAAAHPDYLAYFNRVAGGVRSGPRWLDDSNLDWGQELYRLPAWLRERGIERVRLLYFGAGDAAHYGVATEPLLPADWKVAPRPGDYVVSAHILVYGLLEARTQGSHTDWLDRYQPADVLGGSLYLYRFPAVRSADR